MSSISPDSTKALLSAWRIYGGAAQSLKDRAAFRCEVLGELRKYTREGMPLMKARELVAGTYRNSGKRGISSASIAHWQALVEGHGVRDWPALLLPNYQGRTAFAPIEPGVWMRFKTDFLRPECPSAASCYARLRRATDARAQPLPALKTFLRRLGEEMPHWRQERRSGARLTQLGLFE